MDGVTILNTYMAWIPSRVAFLTIMTAMMGFMILCLYIWAYIDESLVAFLSAFAIAVALVLIWFYVPKTEHIQAIIDPSVSWSELTERYEVVNASGKILTMIEKEDKHEQSISDR